MTPYQILWNLPIVATGLSLLLLVVAAFLRRDRLALVATTLILVNANSAPVVTITADLGLGLGSAWFLMGGVILVLLLCYRLNPVRLLFPLPGWPGLLLFLTLYYILLISPLVSIERVESIRRSLSYTLVYLLGWGIFALIFARRPQLARARMFTILYTGGSWTLVMLVATLILIGPSAASGEISDLRAVITLGPYRGMRLHVDFLPATGLAMSAATSILLIVHWWQNWARAISRRIVLAVMLAITTVVLLWSAGRTAMLAFGGTVVLLLLLIMVTRGGKHRFRAMLALFALGLALVPLTGILSGLFLRHGAPSLQEAFWNDRLSLALEGISAYRSHLVWGTGSGVLLGSFTTGDIAVESFFIRILIELGAVGGTLYLITWLVLTYYVVRVDLYYMRRGYPAAWLPSSGFIFIWVTSPASFGFSIFDGGLVLRLAIAAAAVVEWQRIKAARRQSALSRSGYSSVTDPALPAAQPRVVQRGKI